MNDRELEDFAEYLPSILANASRAAAQIPGTESSTQDELLAALGVALAAAMRLRAELQLEASGELGPYERSVLMHAGDRKPGTRSSTQGELQAALGVARAAAMRLHAEQQFEAASKEAPSSRRRMPLRAGADGDNIIRRKSAPRSGGRHAPSARGDRHPDQL